MLALLAQKIFLNAVLDLKWLTRGPASFRERLAYVLRKYSSIARNKDHVRLGGHNFYYDNRLTPALLPDYLFEIHHLAQWVDFGKARTVLDIGANVGQFAYALKIAHPHLGIFSFEPNPKIFRLLEKNASPFTNWTCFNYGLGVREESATLHFVPGKSGQGSFYRENAVQGLFAEQTETVGVKIKTPAAFKDLPPHFDFIKIDVEGAEIGVLRALAEVSWSYVYVELSANRAGQATVQEAIAALGGRADIAHVSKPAGAAQTFQVLLQRHVAVS